MLSTDCFEIALTYVGVKVMLFVFIRSGADGTEILLYVAAKDLHYISGTIYVVIKKVLPGVSRTDFSELFW